MSRIKWIDRPPSAPDTLLVDLVARGLKPAALVQCNRRLAGVARLAGLDVVPADSGHLMAVCQRRRIGDVISEAALDVLPQARRTKRILRKLARKRLTDYFRAGLNTLERVRRMPDALVAYIVMTGLIHGYRPCCVRFYLAWGGVEYFLQKLGWFGELLSKTYMALYSALVEHYGLVGEPMRCPRCRSLDVDEYYSRAKRAAGW